MAVDFFMHGVYDGEEENGMPDKTEGHVDVACSDYMGGSHMSLIVLAQNGNGIAVSADSRSTIVERSGNMAFENDVTTKVFKIGDAILSFYGRNRTGGLPICKLISQFADEGDDAFDVVAHVASRIRSVKKQESLHGSPGTCTFLLSEFVNTGNRDFPYVPHTRMIELTDGVGEWQTLKYGDMLMCKGWTDMTPQNLSVRQDRTLGELCEDTRLIIEMAEKVGDRILYYNPVGGRIITEALLPPALCETK